MDDLVLLLQEVQALVLAFGRQRAGAEVPESIVRSSCQLEVVGLSFGSVAPELELAYFVEQEPNALGLSALEDACRVFSALRTESVPGLALAPSVVDHIERVTELLDRGYNKIETMFNYNGQRLTGVIVKITEHKTQRVRSVPHREPGGSPGGGPADSRA